MPTQLTDIRTINAVVTVCLIVLLLFFMRSISIRTKEAYQTQQEDYVQKIEQRCKHLLLIRARQIAPIMSATKPDLVMRNPDYQKALLGGTIKDLTKSQMNRKRLFISSFDKSRAKSQITTSEVR